ncbi:MAG: hypothetical protein EOR30_17805 [Mesorhizobium sp.]|uniref:hypothetical protein n=1 Tax=unclassified Mesorhizobium TaxID=325217 RepID=UPI000FCA749E|nr:MULTISPECIES: hypothetical protein [unclassified Mesorhizobium]RUV73206.1 hypothetical protein EOA78_12405 [Mesorhizobium sp. M5C.F.Cr.IN.023.01.1.1]RWF86629.1 MAG: hypothetical protein EOQ36_16330 [Mesorhizobium sp.]RWF95410.1 MAG: hypothetical protein EOQ45_08870 [Mesorhizobium sp.]RWI39752.1 MAG: hypothetical protein EOR14_16780 [Mesorhizobium sp.]RWI45381.1 MAG: hypothetical protein EOR15_23260 [Mesorhizobium sp.]
MTIAVDVNIPGRKAPVRVDFTYQHCREPHVRTRIVRQVATIVCYPYQAREAANMKAESAELPLLLACSSRG